MNKTFQLTASLLVLVFSSVSFAQDRAADDQQFQRTLVENCRDRFLTNPAFGLQNLSQARKQEHCTCVAGLVVAEAREDARANVPPAEVADRIRQMNEFFRQSSRYVRRRGDDIIFSAYQMEQNGLWFPAIVINHLGQCSSQAPRSQNP